MSFSPRVAVITGASSGIGRALAVELAVRGTRVGVTARRDGSVADADGPVAPGLVHRQPLEQSERG